MKLSQTFSIRGIAGTVPKQSISPLHFAETFGEAVVNKIMQATGIEKMRIAPDSMCTSDLCVDAAERLIESLNLKREKIGGLVFVTQTPDYIIPPTSCTIQKRLSLTESTLCYDINYGCSGYIYGMLQAAMLINSGFCENVLVLVGDTLTRRVNDRDRAVRLVFGDGGAATILSKGDSSLFAKVYTDGNGAEYLTIPAGSFRTPSSQETAKEIQDGEGNVRSQNDLYMNGFEIMRFAIQRVPPLVEELLNEANISHDTLERLYLHQANHFVNESLRRSMKLPIEKVPLQVSDFGNTGSATIPLAISADLQNETKMPKNCGMVGFGVGLSWGGIVTSLENCMILPVAEL